MVEGQLLVDVRPAELTNLDAVKALADASRANLGFVLRPVLREAIIREWLYVAVQEAAVIGFVNFRPRQDGWTTIYEICVATTARRHGVGRALLTNIYLDNVRLDICAKNRGSPGPRREQQHSVPRLSQADMPPITTARPEAEGSKSANGVIGL